MPQPELLETFSNPEPKRAYEIELVCAEFTSLCPIGGVETDAAELSLLKGGAPDFGTIARFAVLAQFELAFQAHDLDLDTHDGFQHRVDVIRRRIGHFPGNALRSLMRSSQASHDAAHPLLGALGSALHVLATRG